MLHEVSGIEVEGNTFVRNPVGIEIVNSPGTMISENLLEANGTGWVCSVCGLMANDGNQFRGNDIGIQINNSPAEGYLTIHNDFFEGNRVGIQCNACGLLSNDGNTFRWNDVGIHLNNSPPEGSRSVRKDLFLGNRVGLLCTACGIINNDGNTFGGNQVAIQVQGSTAGGTPTIHNDQIVGNGVGLKNETDATIAASHNYWGCPTGPNTAGCDSTSGAVEFVPVSSEGSIDVMPGTFPNVINLLSRRKIPVAILTTASFDATTVNPSTIRFGPTGMEAAPVQFALQDVDADGDLDMILHFNTQDMRIPCRAKFVLLTGKTFAGQPITGADSVRTASCQ
jgi:parallel beta-helix repeat protein